jgi:hypothetical protein
MMLASIFGDKPVMYVVHRIMFNETGRVVIPMQERVLWDLRHQQAPRSGVLWPLMSTNSA